MTRTHVPQILVTGFSVFPGAPENPTAWVIAALEQQRWRPDGADLITRILPVRYDIWDDVEQTIDRRQPTAVVAFGLSAKATGFTLEHTARNQLGYGRPDAGGACATASHIADGAPATYPSRLPLHEIEANLTKAGLPVVHSQDAGDYICNLFFYRLMMCAAATGTPLIGGFIHVPYLDEQLPRLALAGLPTEQLTTLTQSQLVQGVQITLTTIAAAISSRAGS